MIIIAPTLNGIYRYILLFIYMHMMIFNKMKILFKGVQQIVHMRNNNFIAKLCWHIVFCLLKNLVMCVPITYHT